MNEQDGNDRNAFVLGGGEDDVTADENHAVNPNPASTFRSHDERVAQPDTRTRLFKQEWDIMTINELAIIQ